MTTSMPAWAAEHHARLRATLVDGRPPLYPCYFARAAEAVRGNHYGYLDRRRDRAAELARVAAELEAYLAGFHAPGALRRSTYLCAVGPATGDETLGDDQNVIWELLADLIRVSDAPWPPGTPRDVDDPHWTFCFAGEPLFVFLLSPHYGARRSRRVGSAATVCFQSTAVFHGISGSTGAGRRAKKRIRRALAEYEAAPLIAAMGDGQSSTTGKWRQYAPDADGGSPGRCPLARMDRT